MKLSPLIGLCSACRYVKVIKSAKGSFFVMCSLAKIDTRFAKYPQLPVIQCDGFEYGLSGKAEQSDNQT